MTPAPRDFKVGLRFVARDAMLLDFLADRVERGEIPGEPSTFRFAAEAARTGEPLIVQCRNVDEAVAMAHLYQSCGATRPVIEALPKWAKAR